MTLKFRTLRIGRNHMAFVMSHRGLRRVYLPVARVGELKQHIRRDEPGAEEDPQLEPRLAKEFAQYFAGESVPEFHARMDWSGHGSFEADVWSACARVPYGETESYKGLAERLAMPDAARAVGMAMSRNPCPIVVPCHRIVRSDGSLGGYSGPGGVAFKQRLLEMEARAAVTV